MKRLLIGVAIAATAGVTAQARECRLVHARYAINANRDSLWVIGSKHLLEVSIDALDKELERRGWERTVVFGDFTICAERISDPRQLAVRDRVDVTGYSHLEYWPHR